MDKQLPEKYEINQQDYDFCCKQDQIKTMFMLKRADKLTYLDSDSEVMFPSFILLPNPNKANMHKSTLQSMIDQPTYSELMIAQFCKLARIWFSSYIKQIDTFQKVCLQNEKIGRISPKVQQFALLTEYTRASFFHKLLNKLLRGGNDQTEIYYAQYFVKNLHKGIKNIYKTYNQKQRREFFCYRGANLNQQELLQFQNNIGKYIQTLGFLSATNNIDVAENFAENAIIQIIVQDQLRTQRFDFGYAFITQFSKHPNEDEVLFNAMCSFQIVKVEPTMTRVGQLLKVTLKYGSAAHALAKYLQNNQTVLSQVQRSILPLLTLQDHSQNDTQMNIFTQYSLQWVYYHQIWLQAYDSYLRTIDQNAQYQLISQVDQYLQEAKNLLRYYETSGMKEKYKILRQDMLYWETINTKINQRNQHLNKPLTLLDLSTIQQKLDKIKQSIDNNFNEDKARKQIKVCDQMFKQICCSLPIFQMTMMEKHQRDLIMRGLKIVHTQTRTMSLMIDLLSKNCNQYQLWQSTQQLIAQIREQQGEMHPHYIKMLPFESRILQKYPHLSTKTWKQVLQQFQQKSAASSPCDCCIQKQSASQQLIAAKLKEGKYEQAVKICKISVDRFKLKCIAKSAQIDIKIQENAVAQIINKFNALSASNHVHESIILVKLLKQSFPNLKQLQQAYWKQRKVQFLYIQYIMPNLQLRMNSYLPKRIQQLQQYMQCLNNALQYVQQIQNQIKLIFPKQSYIYIGIQFILMQLFNMLSNQWQMRYQANGRIWSMRYPVQYNLIVECNYDELYEFIKDIVAIFMCIQHEYYLYLSLSQLQQYYGQQITAINISLHNLTYQYNLHYIQLVAIFNQNDNGSASMFLFYQ